MAEDGEEIKIFRVRTEDESDAPSLADDKKDVALEEEMVMSLISDGRSAFHPPSTLSSMPSPLPLFSSAGFNPFQQLAIQQWQMLIFQNQAMIANAAANAFAAALSPTFTAHPMPASPLDLFSRTMSALSPLTGPRVGMMGRGLGGMGSALPLASPFPNLLNPMQLMGYGAGMAPSTSTAATGRKRANEKTKKAHNEEDKKEHIKKPKNAFFFFMKENRGVLKSEEEWKDRHSANLNAEFGKRWRELTDEEKQPYYDMAAKDKEDHAKKYPNWNASENYAIRAKNKTKRDRTSKPVEGKKCRARFGLDNQQKWCKNCGIKKKCIFAGKGEEDEKEEREINQTASDSD
ncbi:hypothetical protein PENTCL1PPCAC_24098 [Pristionchus entomophagus]|uniref:HMG box domain-containing protein n=1 Tax=Pristionchus entomophagus TaxID=358040 RepID=A0AAV5U508_9BILA|nr:hypothetical protein PENTCL1PPCAC_24098 [Pristionchus entomophagus]